MAEKKQDLGDSTKVARQSNQNAVTPGSAVTPGEILARAQAFSNLQKQIRGATRLGGRRVNARISAMAAPPATSQ